MRAREGASISGCPETLLSRIVCPRCSGELEITNDKALNCRGCSCEWPVKDRVPILVENPQEPAQARPDTGVAFRARQRGHESPRRFRRRLNRNRQQLHIVTDMLSSLPSSSAILNLPCGSGRLSVPMQSAARILIEADINLNRVNYAVEHAMNPHRVLGLCCDAFRLPIKDGAVDGTVCIGFSRHLSSPTLFESCLHEMLRVSSSFVLFSFVDMRSVTNLWRLMRFKSIHPRSASIDAVRTVGSKHGATIESALTTSPMGSRYRYVLIRKAKL